MTQRLKQIADQVIPPSLPDPTIAAKNLSFVLSAPYKVSYEDRPIPVLKSEHDVLVHVNWTGICGSDIHYYVDGSIGRFILRAPMVLGHESSGTITAIGSAVTTLKPGDRVALEPGVPCRRCPRCKEGTYNLCPSMTFAASPPNDGTLTKYYALPEDFCHILPESMTLEEGAVVEPTAVAVHIVKQAHITPGDTLVVFGAGPVGLLCCAVARAFGAGAIIIVDIQPHRVAFATSWIPGGNVTGFIPPPSSSPEENARAILSFPSNNIPSSGADIVIDASGAPLSIRTALHVLRTGGTYVQGGMGASSIDAFPIMALCTKEVTVKGSFRYGAGDFELAVGLIAEGKVGAGELVTGKVAFREAERAYREVRGGRGIKWLIEGVRD